MGGNEIKLLTITDNIKHCLDYYDQLRMHQKKDMRDRFSVRSEVEKICPKDKRVMISTAL